jgi:hypothetical protein
MSVHAHPASRTAVSVPGGSDEPIAISARVSATFRPTSSTTTSPARKPAQPKSRDRRHDDRTARLWQTKLPGFVFENRPALKFHPELAAHNPA